MQSLFELSSRHFEEISYIFQVFLNRPRILQTPINRKQVCFVLYEAVHGRPLVRSIKFIDQN